MYAEDLVLGGFVGDAGTKWHKLEHVIDLLEDTVRIINILLESRCALLSKSEVSVHVAVFMVASQ